MKYKYNIAVQYPSVISLSNIMGNITLINLAGTHVQAIDSIQFNIYIIGEMQTVQNTNFFHCQ